MNTSLQPVCKLRSLAILALSLRALAAILLIVLGFAPLSLFAQGLTGTYTAESDANSLGRC